MHTTDFLVSRNGFLSGMGRVLDLGATRRKFEYNDSNSAQHADYRALKNDWNMIGQDIRGKIYELEKERETDRRECCTV